MVGGGGGLDGGRDSGRFVSSTILWLTAFSDIIQSLLLLSGAAAFVPLALRSRGRVRLFWSLIAMGVPFWLAYQMFWTYYEVWLRRDVPDLCAWDVVLFLHMVPLMAALGIRPQFSRDEYSARVGVWISLCCWYGGFIYTF